MTLLMLLFAAPASADCVLEHFGPTRPEHVRGVTFVGSVVQRVVIDGNEDWYEPELLYAYRFHVERVYAGGVDSGSNHDADRTASNQAP